MGLSPLGEQHLRFYCSDTSTSGPALFPSTPEVSQRWRGPRESVRWGKGVLVMEEVLIPRWAPNSGPDRDLGQLHHCGSPAALGRRQLLTLEDKGGAENRWGYRGARGRPHPA